jgi:hypothetical protein
MKEKEIPEVIILDAQESADRIIRTDIPNAVKTTKNVKANLVAAEINERGIKQKFKDYISFLQEHSPETVDGTWWDEYRITPEYGVEQTCYNCKKCISKSSDIEENDCPELNAFKKAICQLMRNRGHMQGGETYDYEITNTLTEMARIIASHCGDFEYDDSLEEEEKENE